MLRAYSAFRSNHAAVILAVSSPSVTITLRGEERWGQAMADARLTKYVAAGRCRSADGRGRYTGCPREPGWPVLADRARGAGGGRRWPFACASGGIAHYQEHHRVPGRQGAGWRSGGVTASPMLSA